MELKLVNGDYEPDGKGGMASLSGAEEVLARAGVGPEGVDRFVFHQANQRIIDLAVRKLKLPVEKCAGNIDHTGNTSAASIPLLLDELVSAGQLKQGQRALCVGFGAGLTWAGALLELR